MRPRVKMGLIVGVAGLILNSCVSFALGLCGPFASLLAGGVAGYFAASQEKPATKNEGARSGAIAGGIAGAFMIIGQIIGGAVALTVQQSTGTVPLVGSVESDLASQATFYLTGAMTGVCFGLVGAALAAGAGAGVGYMVTQEQAPSGNTPM